MHSVINHIKNLDTLFWHYKDLFFLVQGDSLEILKKIPDESVDMIFADPPYFLSNDGITVHSGKRVKVNKGDWDKSMGFEKDAEFHKKWITESKRILKSSGTIWISGTYHNIYQCGYILQELGFHIINEICWYKPNAAPNISCKSFAHAHETLIWAKKDKNHKHYFNYELMKYSDYEEDFFKNKDKQMRSVWAITTPKNSEKIYGKHPTQKPVELLSRIIKATTKEQDIILDPFTGSGTTGVAVAREDKRIFIGIEREIKYLEIAKKRILHEINNSIFMH